MRREPSPTRRRRVPNHLDQNHDQRVGHDERGDELDGARFDIGDRRYAMSGRGWMWATLAAVTATQWLLATTWSISSIVWTTGP